MMVQCKFCYTEKKATFEKIVVCKAMFSDLTFVSRINLYWKMKKM